MTDTPLDYATAGVDTAAGDRAVELMKSAVAATHDSTVLGATGGFAGMVDASALLGMEKPLLATSTDGVGTKIAIAQAMDVHDTIGQDLVGMVVDDIVVIGARPVLMTDYIACGHVVPERIAAIVTGIARACEATGTPLIGGETAEHPGVMAPDDYDIAGAATGVVDASKLLGPERVTGGDVVIAMASSGLHSNGYSLVRSVVSRVGASLESHVAEFGRTLGEELLELFDRRVTVHSGVELHLVHDLVLHEEGRDEMQLVDIVLEDLDRGVVRGLDETLDLVVDERRGILRIISRRIEVAAEEHLVTVVL